MASVGHSSIQASHSMHSDVFMMAIPFFIAMASTGQILTHSPHAEHRLLNIIKLSSSFAFFCAGQRSRVLEARQGPRTAVILIKARLFIASMFLPPFIVLVPTTSISTRRFAWRLFLAVLPSPFAILPCGGGGHPPTGPKLG